MRPIIFPPLFFVLPAEEEETCGVGDIMERKQSELCADYDGEETSGLLAKEDAEGGRKGIGGLTDLEREKSEKVSSECYAV
jgi:hypothetical protein